MKVVIVESPSKAKTISKYLGKDYKILASYGHIRKLISKSGSIKPENNFEMLWEETTQAKKYMKNIVENLKNADELYLATDPDREGEAISWHLVDYLKKKKVIKASLPIKRVVFNSITKDNIIEAFKNSRNIDDNLVNAYKARLALDYLVGYSISPILWRKLPGSRSAGRVQSVALRLICERENEIEDFIPIEYWTLGINLNNSTKNPSDINSKLIFIDGREIDKLSIKTEEDAENLKAAIINRDFIVSNIENKKVKRNPYAPFTTSTLQQDAFNKLGFSAKRTMQIAQKLYEGVNIGSETVGLITYMRTDATQIDASFINIIRNYIQKEIGNNYLYSSIRKYQTKNKNAQEAHEAIRPTDVYRTPSSLSKYLSDEMLKLYTLIWKRAVASQMESAVYDTCTVTLNHEERIILKSSGSILEFDGFYKIYNKETNKEEDNLLPNLNINDTFLANDIETKQHFTEPAPRYTEATLVKKLEEMGIGRPSTYAGIISVLQDREYTRVENKKFIPETRGRILNIFLTHYFERILEYNFTADMEESLDLISSGTLTWLEVLQKFWNDFDKHVKDAKNISHLEVIDIINKVAADHFIGEDKSCPHCHDGTLQIKTSKYGAFIGCSNYPECTYTKQLEVFHNDEEQNMESDILLGQNNGMNIHLKKGPYGFYVEQSSNPPKRIKVPDNLKPDDVTLEKALYLLELPKDLGEGLILSVGKFGPYIKKGKEFFSYKYDIFEATLETAKEAVETALKRKHGIPIGKYNGEEIAVNFGRFGAYIKYQGKNHKIPKGFDPEKLELKDIEKILNK